MKSVFTKKYMWAILAGMFTLLLPLLASTSVHAASSAEYSQQEVYYNVVGLDSGKCLDVQGDSSLDGTPVIQYHCDGGENQEWYAISANRNGAFYIVSRASGKCLAVGGDTSSDQAPVMLEPCAFKGTEQWRRPSGAVSPLISLHSNKCLDIPDDTNADVVPLQQYSCDNGRNQDWEFVLV
ncbi:hypothetical protein EPA93_38245 [Ktedonosporobacter rubrisoli]|uniref:Ricin B lectin domain-containing protein n=1 Tax=Ktedonosporobacter rubrisoli TaxID=2509675 RepID=A0A4P6K114_KTERU|nr:RICIN domain-containing protein [Ktedonosporobacter rubrisoli]QBD81502.1 hypothetical protein EPA93_38245 [Ktedonosporobacter rubrisoli]